MTNNVGLTFSVGETIPWFAISLEQDNYCHIFRFLSHILVILMCNILPAYKMSVR